MNITELMLDLNKILHESGWIEKATAHFKEHPEYFKKGKYTAMASIDMSFALFTEQLYNTEHPDRAIYINTRGSDNFLRSCDEYNDKITFETLGISNYKMLEKEEISFEDFCEYVHNHMYCAVHKWITGRYCHDTLSLTYEQVNEWLQAQDVKDKPVCYKDSRHAWIEFGGGFWENTKTGEQGQDKTVMEVWF